MTYEEAIKYAGLEVECLDHLLNGECPVGICRECEFFSDDEAVREAFEMLKKAAEKQIPKKPIQKYKHIKEYMYCPVCDEYIANRYAEYKPPFCEHCGQALDWSDNK